MKVTRAGDMPFQVPYLRLQSREARTDEELNHNRLRKLNALDKKYYDQMYESGRGANGCYSNAKDAFYDAIGLANELGLKDEAEALSKRLEHIKAV